MFKQVFLSLLIFSVTGCSSVKFSSNEKNEYTLQKTSDACAAGMPSKTLEFLRQEALRFCAGRKEFVAEISSEEIIGIPIIRCAEASLTFSCKPK